MFEPDELKEAEKFPTLGPGYFSARKFAERLMSKAGASDLKTITDQAASDFHTKLQESIESYLLSDVESNVQGEIYRTADNIVKYLLSGDGWAMKKYALGERYDCEKIRAAIASHIPKELQDARIADLEKQVADLRKDNEFYRNIR